VRIVACIFLYIGGSQAFQLLQGWNWDLNGAYISLIQWPLTPLTIGLLLFCFSFRNSKVMYWSLLISIWLISISAWYRQSTGFDITLTGYFTTPLTWPSWILLPIVSSLLLLVLYMPFMHTLVKIMNPHVSKKGKIKDVRFEEYIQTIREQSIRQDPCCYF